jgi:VanZ family protein
MSLLPWKLPFALRLALYAIATSALLYLCLAPSEALPKERIWDKAEHSLAWGVLAGTGFILFLRHPRMIAAFSLLLGVVVEILQGALPIGRHGDWRDLVADSIGVAAAVLLRVAMTHLLGRR